MSDQEIQRISKNSTRAISYVAAIIMAVIIYVVFGPFVLLGAAPILFSLVAD